MVYAKIRNPEWFDYRVYECDIDENIIIDGGKEFASINDEYLVRIKKMIDDYNCYDYDYYYEGSIKAYLYDMLPKKENSKRYSPKEIHDIKVKLDSNYRYYSDYEEEVILKCLSIITGNAYGSYSIRGCSQGDYAKVYAPTSTSTKYLDYIEAIYFNTGNEIEIHDEDSEVNDANDIYGWTYYTTEWNEDDIKEEIASKCGCDKKDVVLYKFTGYSRVENYEKC